MLTYIGQSKYVGQRCLFPTFKVTGYACTNNFEISFVLPLPWTLLEVSVRWEKQIWHLNIKSKELKWPVSLVCKMSSSLMDLCTFFTIWDMHRALANCWHPTIFSTLVIFHSTLQCSFISLSLVSKLKLNTWVLKYSKYSPKYSSTPWGTQILEYSMWYCLKYSYLKYFLAVKGLGSHKFPCMSH